MPFRAGDGLLVFQVSLVFLDQLIGFFGQSFRLFDALPMRLLSLLKGSDLIDKFPVHGTALPVPSVKRLFEVSAPRRNATLRFRRKHYTTSTSTMTMSRWMTKALSWLMPMRRGARGESHSTFGIGYRLHGHRLISLTSGKP